MQKMLILSLAAIGVICLGCQSTYVSGTQMRPHFTMAYYEARLAQDPEAVYRAALKAMKDLEIKAEGKQDKLSGQVTGDLADGARLKIRILKIIPAGALVEIHVNEFVDKPRSVAILEAIKKHLD